MWPEHDIWVNSDSDSDVLHVIKALYGLVEVYWLDPWLYLLDQIQKLPLNVLKTYAELLYTYANIILSYLGLYSGPKYTGYHKR